MQETFFVGHSTYTGRTCDSDYEFATLEASWHTDDYAKWSGYFTYLFDIYKTQPTARKQEIISTMIHALRTYNIFKSNLKDTTLYGMVRDYSRQHAVPMINHAEFTASMKISTCDTASDNTVISELRQLLTECVSRESMLAHAAAVVRGIEEMAINHGIKYATRLDRTYDTVRFVLERAKLTNTSLHRFCSKESCDLIYKLLNNKIDATKAINNWKANYRHSNQTPVLHVVQKAFLWNMRTRNVVYSAAAVAARVASR